MTVVHQGLELRIQNVHLSSLKLKCLFVAGFDNDPEWKDLCRELQKKVPC